MSLARLLLSVIGASFFERAAGRTAHFRTEIESGGRIQLSDAPGSGAEDDPDGLDPDEWTPEDYYVKIPGKATAGPALEKLAGRAEAPPALPALFFAGSVTSASISVGNPLGDNLAANPSWQYKKIEEIGPDDGWSNCPARCRISRNISDLPTAAAFIYNVIDLKMIDYLAKPKPAGQSWYVSDFFEHPKRKFASRWRAMKPYAPLIDGALTFFSDRVETPLACPMFTVEQSGRLPDLPGAAPLGRSPQLLGSLAEKTHLVTWVASKCYPKRVRYAERLKAKLAALLGRPAETFWRDYGGCAPGSEKISGPALAAELAKTKFYLAFENSECKGYVTEKPARALANGAVPVVMGGLTKADYAARLPPNSYLHTDDFASPEDLAEKLVALDQDAAAYAAFFRWQEDHRVVQGCPHALCAVCQRAHGRSFSLPQFNVSRWVDSLMTSCRP